jgi:hypothetical protein
VRSGPAVALSCVASLAACASPQYTTATVIRYRDAHALQITVPPPATARAVDSDKSETEFSVEPVHMQDGTSGLKWKTGASLTGGDETPLVLTRACGEGPHDDKDTEHCPEQDPMPAPGLSLAVADAEADALLQLVRPQLVAPVLTIPGCAELLPTMSGSHGSYHNAGFATHAAVPCFVPRGVGFEIATPWSNVLDVSTGQIVNRAGTRALMWRELFGGIAFTLLGGGSIAGAALVDGSFEGSRGSLLALGVLCAAGGIYGLYAAASSYATIHVPDRMTVIYPSSH